LSHPEVDGDCFGGRGHLSPGGLHLLLMYSSKALNDEHPGKHQPFQIINISTALWCLRLSDLVLKDINLTRLELTLAKQQRL